MDQIVNVNEFQGLVKQALSKMYYDFYGEGAEDQHTFEENLTPCVLLMFRFRPRVLVDVSKIDTSTRILGYPISSPIMIAPTAMHMLAHPQGETATAKAAAACNTIMIVSFMASCTIEDVASSCNAVRFLQIYQREVTAQMVKRAEKAGFKAIVLTVDVPKLGRREADIKNKLISPKLKNFEGLFSTELRPSEGSGMEAVASRGLDASFSWKDIEWLRSITKLPILVKGILTREDGKIHCCGSWCRWDSFVSNHGARQLDYSPATITVLEEVVHVVGRRVPVLLDGGIRRGTDVFKALALGAKAVLIGRPVVYGLAAKGEDGVKKVIDIPSKDEPRSHLSWSLISFGFSVASFSLLFNMDQIVNVNEFQEMAKRALPKMYYDYFYGGAEDEHTVKENVEAFHRIMFRPRVLVDVSKIDMSTSVLGYPISAPIMIAPVALLKLAHPEGEIATARAAAACNTIMIVSYMASCTIEEVASSCNAVRFLQIYVFKKHEIAQMVIRAEKAGFKAIVLTNAPRIGKREADIKNKMISPQLKNFGGLFPTEVQPIKGSGLETLSSTALDSSFGWKDIEWLRSITKLPILIKGILTREDALKAVEAGVDGIVVSNHGGRQLDYSPATITVLEEVVHVVRGRIPVLFDGGVRRGTDVFKALALGAQAVLIGRPLAYALAAKGEDGVKQGIEMLKNEFELTMALSGCPTIGDITRNHVKAEAERLHSML
ncbi:hypothetical protein HID58_019534 [Brassica napus]|uniref:(S)-2-hydroxy-acid oxidase n=2 Tax=Brassica napus TaxID=3708 RepID=A0ABQ8DER9_BRANA|nr:hypothetical protein HID58_019534 [Brassica napus]